MQEYIRRMIYCNHDGAFRLTSEYCNLLAIYFLSKAQFHWIQLIAIHSLSILNLFGKNFNSLTTVFEVFYFDLAFLLSFNV